jgi:hypothetical protein
MGAAGDVVGDKGPSLSHRLGSADCGVLRSLELELGIYLSAEEHDVEREVQPKQQNDHGSERTIRLIVMSKIENVD